MRAIDQMVCRLNRVLRGIGVTIYAERGTGYFLDEPSRKRLADLMR